MKTITIILGALNRLKAQLKSGIKPLESKRLRNLSDKDYQIKINENAFTEPLTESDRKRISKEISILESRII
jgi:hypothetical protein